jgi:hypothetical protein
VSARQIDLYKSGDMICPMTSRPSKGGCGAEGHRLAMLAFSIGHQLDRFRRMAWVRPDCEGTGAGGLLSSWGFEGRIKMPFEEVAERPVGIPVREGITSPRLA